MSSQSLSEIPIITENGVNPVFTRAMSHIISIHQDKFVGLSFNDKIKKLEELWNLEYNSSLSGNYQNNNKWDFINFSHYNSMTAFLLKFG